MFVNRYLSNAGIELKGLKIRTRLVLLAILAATQLATADEWHFSDVERVVAFSDVHGDFDAMVATLQSAEVIDSELGWSGGKTNFVLIGDILDRGPGSRAAMDLLIRLEKEAESAGGRVHILLGNHEIMNMIGDLRYVHSGEYAAFAEEETAAVRDFWYEAYIEERVNPGQESEHARIWFDKAYPAGFFALNQAFSPDGQYGKWLKNKPMIVVVNDSAFVHGGLSPTVAEVGLQGINGDLLGDVRLYAQKMQVLIEAHVLLPTDRNRDHVAILQRFKLRDVQTREVKAAMADVLRLNHESDAGKSQNAEKKCPNDKGRETRFHTRGNHQTVKDLQRINFGCRGVVEGPGRAIDFVDLDVLFL